MIGAVKLKGIFGNINAQHVYSHVDLPSKVKVHQTKSSPEDPAVLAAWVGMVHYISTMGADRGLGAGSPGHPPHAGGSAAESLTAAFRPPFPVTSR